MFQQRSIFGAGLAICIANVLLVSVNGGIPPKMKCLDQEVDLKDCFKGFEECASTMMPAEEVKAFTDPNTPEDKKKEIGMKAHKNLCIRVCQWKKHQHLLNEDGTWNKTSADTLIDSKFPEAARADLKSGLTQCHTDNSKGFKEDNQCESYGPLEKCMTETYMKVCKVDKKDVHMDGME